MSNHCLYIIINTCLQNIPENKIEDIDSEYSLIISVLNNYKLRLKLLAEIDKVDQFNYKEMILIKFYNYVREYKFSKTKRERILRGKKIISMFLERGFMHELNMINIIDRLSVIRTKRFRLNLFDCIVNLALDILIESTIIKTILKKYF